MLKAMSFVRAGMVPTDALPFDLAVLAHDERHLRRKLLTLVHGDEVLVDLPSTVRLESGDCLVLEDGRLVDIQAAEERLYEIRGRDAVHMMQLCWHIGNRHLPAQITGEWEGIGLRVVIQRDHVIKDMLEGLGATITEISEPFSPEPGAYAHGDHSHALLNR